MNIFLIVIGRSPYGESFPPSRLNPNPAPSFFSVTVMGGPRGTSTNFKSRKKVHFKIVMYFGDKNSMKCTDVCQIKIIRQDGRSEEDYGSRKPDLRTLI